MSNDSGYEKSDVNVSQVVGWSLVIIVVLVAILVFMNEYFSYTKDKLIYETRLRPESKQLRDLRAREDQILNSYKVTDAEEGIYQIPVERAMKVMADEAYAQRKEAQQN